MVQLDVSTKLAFDCTRLAHERTLMAWLRTATSPLTFGFTIYKFFQLETTRFATKSGALIGPTKFALLMTSIRLLSLLMATWNIGGICGL